MTAVVPAGAITSGQEADPDYALHATGSGAQEFQRVSNCHHRFCKHFAGEMDYYGR